MRLSLRDPVTGLPNRAVVCERIGRAVRAAADRTGALSVLVLDLDRFTEINVALGHATGDALLRQVGARLNARLPEGAFVASLGADEFAILLPRGEEERATAVARDFIGALERPFSVGGQPIAVEASVGVASYPEHGTDADALLRHADVAMYAAKRAGSGYAVYAPEQDPGAGNPLALLAELREGIARDELVLHYQPQVSLGTGEVVGMEALVRWRHPRRGLLEPAAFIPIAERTGVMQALSRWVLERALRECRVCVPRGGRLRVSVNLSVRDLRDPELPETIAALVDRHGGGAVWLSVEITESAVMADAERARAALLRLRDLGVRLAVDDFGTGYSSLAYLVRLPVDALKIDKSFVSSLAADAGNRAIVKAVVDLGHSLGLEVVAEGVEDQQAWDVLAALGCDTAQGYFVAPPMDGAALERWMVTR